MKPDVIWLAQLGGSVEHACVESDNGMLQALCGCSAPFGIGAETTELCAKCNTTLLTIRRMQSEDKRLQKEDRRLR